MEKPLVSVVVASYKTSATILETLESVKAQTYENLELIVTDDHSTDNTVGIVRQWMAENGSRFVRCELVESETNTGVSANFNRGVKAAKGQWIKTFASDDILLPNAIARYCEVAAETNERMYLARVELFGGEEYKYKRVYANLEYRYSRLKNRSRRAQYRSALYAHILPGPALFYQRSLWEEIGGFDEAYPMSEEMAFQVKALEIARVCFIDETLVRWRQEEGSLSRSVSPAKFQDIDFYFKVRRPRLLREKMFLHVLDADITNFLAKKDFTGGAGPWRLLRLCSPLFYYNKLRSL